MTARARRDRALLIWRARTAHTGAERAFASYAFVLACLAVGAPLVHALWRAATSAAGMTLLTSATMPTLISAGSGILWAAALLLGRLHGPAHLPPFLLHALGGSDLRRSLVLRGTLARVLILIVAGFAESGA